MYEYRALFLQCLIFGDISRKRLYIHVSKKTRICASKKTHMYASKETYKRDLHICVKRDLHICVRRNAYMHPPKARISSQERPTLAERELYASKETFLSIGLFFFNASFSVTHLKRGCMYMRRKRLVCMHQKRPTCMRQKRPT